MFYREINKRIERDASRFDGFYYEINNNINKFDVLLNEIVTRIDEGKKEQSREEQRANF